MNMNMNTAAAESLRAFAFDKGEIDFSYLVLAALAGEEWAVARVAHCLLSIAECVDTHGECSIADDHRRFLISITDTTRPDGAIARSVQP